jgi:hypothetical protein
MRAETQVPTPAAGAAGSGREAEHWTALYPHYRSADFEAVIERIGADGLHRVSLALLAMSHRNPQLAHTLAAAFASYTDEVDNLLLTIGDMSVRLR